MSVPDLLVFLPKFFYSQFFITPTYPTTDCTGKTIIVTGANTGLGKEAARHYVRLNAAKVIIACRSAERGEAAKNDIETTTKRQGVVEVWQLDLASYQSVKDFAQRAKGLARLDTVVENAGISKFDFAMMEDNESTVTVNVVSTFLLALLILPKLQETSRRFNVTPNLCIVSSELHFVTKFQESKSADIFAALNDPKEAKMGDRYNVSKMMEVLACREIARQSPVTRTKVTINFVNPGWCHSDLMRDISNPIISLAKRLFCRTTEVGSRTLVGAGLAGPETHGEYLHNSQVYPVAPLVRSKEGEEMQRKTWDQLKAKLEEIEPGVTNNLNA